ncbi:6091_t:CDS:2 [Ambispora gerdemannii]|uniref:6091_t:CDS:1 n=1 Tax=Ambispora gerdemannii TaxID=144530 RepID=A0A9N9GR05_9GLOM|nr:6091_t:CDS:2 [Ambispora gerdemannii]
MEASDFTPNVVVDSLPYIDNEINYEGMREQVDKLVEQERRKRTKKDPPNFPATIELFKDSPMLAAELQRVQLGKPMEQIDTNRYKLEPPQDSSNVESWKKAADNSKAQLEQQNLRLLNMELLHKYGANAWRLHNFQLEQELKQLQGTLEQYKQEILEVNKERKAEQLQAGKRLEMLESSWSDLVGKTLQVQFACDSLEKEVENLRQVEQQLKTELGIEKLALNDQDSNETAEEK